MTTQEKIAVMQAHDENKPIECRGGTLGMEWRGVCSPLWDFSVYDYRVKPQMPKPRESFVVLNCITKRIEDHGHESAHDAREQASCNTCKVLRFVEDLSFVE